MKKYNNLTDLEKKNIIYDLYTEKLKSFADIAVELDTYSNRIRRDAKKFGIKIRNKSEAQQNALHTGKTKHPTSGTNRSDATKSKIGLGIAKSWDGMSKEKKQKISEKKRSQWDSLSDDQKMNMTKLANNAVRLASKTGSKLEKYILEKLIKDNFKVEFHKEQILSDTKLQIDLFLPSINTAIEVDGPSHFSPVWGDDALKRNIKYDKKKEGLLLGKGCVLIRIKQSYDFSKTRSQLIYDKLKVIIDQIVKKFPESDNRIINIEDSI